MWLIEEGTSASLATWRSSAVAGEIAHPCATRRSRAGSASAPAVSRGSADGAVEPCTKHPEQLALTRSATNAYFPQIVSVISLPVEEDALIDIVQRHFADLSGAASVAEIAQARRFNSALRMDFEGYSDADVFDRLRQIKASADRDAQTNPKVREFDVLASGNAEIGVNAPDARLYAETLSRDSWDKPVKRDLGTIRSIVAVHRLREVMCLYGFTRFEPAATDADGDLEDIQLAVEGAPIAQHADWLPAIEQLGEGLFIHFDSAAIDRWELRPEVAQRIGVLARGVPCA